MLRLLCEYLNLPYYDRFFNPDEWKTLKLGEGCTWKFKELPFLRHGDFLLTGHHAMITYVIQLSGDPFLLGKTLGDTTKIDAFMSQGLDDAILSYICTGRLKGKEKETIKQQREFHEKKITKLMEFYEKKCAHNGFYLGYLTILDFLLYEIVNYCEKLFPQKIFKFPNLIQIRNSVLKIPKILEYEKSLRAVRDYCPLRYFNRFK